MKRYFVLNISSFLILINLSAHAQFNYKASLEGGILNNKFGSSGSSTGFYGNLDGVMNYLYQDENKEANVQLRIRPEIIGEVSASSFKTKAAGSYVQYEETYDWGINLSFQKLLFNRDDYEIDYSVFSFVSNFSYFFESQLSADINAGYAYQTRAGTMQDDYDLIFMDMFLYNNFSRYVKGGLGLYFEGFWNVELYRELVTYNEIKNRGTKVGPQLSFYLLSDNTIQFQYRFNFVSSSITEFPSTENWVRIVAGKLLSDEWSIFGMMDYLFRSIKIDDIYSGTRELVFGPENLENRIYLKLIYEPEENMELYLKAGYFKENFMASQMNFEGLSFVLGLEINND
ncbi:MAG: hypothetical protein V1720_14925 [bacterium]